MFIDCSSFAAPQSDWPPRCTAPTAC